MSRPKDANPFAQEKEPIEWKSEYQRTIGTTTTDECFPLRERGRNEFASTAENFYWNTDERRIDTVTTLIESY